MRDPLDLTFTALSDSTRRALITKLSKGESNVSELAKPFLNEMSLPAITKHLQVLERAGLITKIKDAQRRSCKLNGAPIKEALEWMDQYRIFWDESLDRLDIYLKSISKKKLRKAKNGSKKIKRN